MSNSPAVGIDLGTTFSVIAHLDGTGRPSTIPNAEGDLLTPSVVLFDGENVVVGKEAVLLAAVIPAVMPFAWMDEIHRQLDMGDLPRGPIMGYLTRSLSAMYAMHGGLVLFVSLDVRRFLPVIKCLAVLIVIFGIGMIVLDIMVGMPWFWVLGEGPIIIIFGGILLWLAGAGRIAEEPDCPNHTEGP